MNRTHPRSASHEQVYRVLRSARGLMTAYEILDRGSTERHFGTAHHVSRIKSVDARRSRTLAGVNERLRDLRRPATPA